MIKIMFVCHGNICRSPMAEFIMKDMVSKLGVSSEFFIASSATSTEEIGNPIYPPARAELTKQGISFDRREATQLARSDYGKYDLFVGMDAANIRNMHRIFGSDPDSKIIRLLDLTASRRDVKDPWYTGNFAETFSDIKDGCKALIEHLKASKMLKM